MTTLIDSGATATAAPSGPQPDRRGSWIPTGAMIATRIMELRKRRGLMIALVAVNIGIPVVFLTIRLLIHAVDPASYGPAGGYQIYTALVARIMFIFGFIVAATLGCTAGSVDLSEGMFRHLVVTGRSRLALYLARIPAGLAIVVPIVAIGFTVVCAVCVFAAPTQDTYGGRSCPPTCRARPSRTGPPTTPTRCSASSPFRSDRLLRSAPWSAASPATSPRGPRPPRPSPRVRSGRRPGRWPGWTMPTTPGSFSFPRTH